MGGCLKKGGGLEPSYKLWYGVSKIKPCLTHYENSLMFHTIDCMTVLEALSLSAIFWCPNHLQSDIHTYNISKYLSLDKGKY